MEPSSPTQLFAKDIIQLIGIFFTLIAALTAVYYTKKASTSTKYIDTITNSRIQWMQTLRKYLCDFISAYNENDANDTNKNKMLLSKYQIQLHLNPNGPIDKVLVQILDEICESDNPMAETQNISKLIMISQKYLKEEWERVKLETQKGYFVKESYE